MPPLRGIKWRDTHKAMHPCLSLEVPERIWTGDLDRNALDSALVLLHIKHFALEAMAFSPSRVHAHQHLCPVGSLVAASSGMDSEEHIVLVILPIKESLEPEWPENAVDLLDLPLQLRPQILILLSLIELDKLLGLIDLINKLLPGIVAVLERSKALERLLRLLGVIPEIRSSGLLLNGLYL